MTRSVLDDLLCALAAHDASAAAPPHVERAVMGVWDQAHRAPGRTRARAGAGWRIAVAAAAVVAAVVWTDQRNAHRPSPVPDRPALSGWFILGGPVVDGTPVSRLRLRMARGELTALGWSLPDPDARATIEIDVLVGADGVARAIQPVALVGLDSEPTPLPVSRSTP